METNIISVKYEDDQAPKTFNGKAYHYYTAVNVIEGDLVIAPTAHGNKIARVSEINVPEYKIARIKPHLKIITAKINKAEFLQNDQVMKEAA